jgi:hypothetical protein
LIILFGNELVSGNNRAAVVLKSLQSYIPDAQEKQVY